MKRFSIFRDGATALSIGQINDSYPNQWVALAVTDTDPDGLPTQGQVLAHNREESLVWSAARLGEREDLIHIFFTGARQADRVAA